MKAQKQTISFSSRNKRHQKELEFLLALESEDRNALLHFLLYQTGEKLHWQVPSGGLYEIQAEIQACFNEKYVNNENNNEKHTYNEQPEQPVVKPVRTVTQEEMPVEPSETIRPKVDKSELFAAARAAAIGTKD